MLEKIMKYVNDIDFTKLSLEELEHYTNIQISFERYNVEKRIEENIKNSVFGEDKGILN